MSMKCCVIILVLLKLSGADDNDLFSSTADLTRLRNLETKFISDLQALAAKLDEEHRTITRFIKEHYEGQEPRNESYVTNPINSLYMIKRLGVELPRSNVTSVLASSHAETLKLSLANMTSSFPGRSDWLGAANGVFLLQEHYNLNISQLSAGVIEYEEVTLTSDHQLAGEELYQIGVSSVNEGYYDTGIEWLQLARARLALGDKLDFLDGGIKQLDDHIKTAKQIHDHYLDKTGEVGAKHRCNRLPFNEKLRKKKKYKTAKKEPKKRVEKDKTLVPLFSEFKEKVIDGKKEPYKEADMRPNFEDVCIGESHRSPEMDIGQKCRHLHHSDDFTRLGPFKLEQVSSQPFITVVHELMTDTEAEHFKDYARDKLVRSGHGNNHVNTEGIHSFKRTSKQTWLEHRKFWMNFTEEVITRMGVNTAEEAKALFEEDYSSWNYYYMTKNRAEHTDMVATRVSDRMERLGQFRLWSPYTSESFQVANYGLGGQYSTHLDPHSYWQGATRPGTQLGLLGDRLATIMVYLEEVAAGGATAFPSTGIRIPVKKGDAVFWVNLRTSGFVDRLTHHGGCPVLVGSKWITNKWVGYLDQWKSWPCSRGFTDRYKPFKNRNYF